VNGRCPDWARPATADAHTIGALKQQQNNAALGALIVLQTTCWETGDVLADTLRDAGYATIWIPNSDRRPTIRGAAAGIWEGRQLDQSELCRLADFSKQLAKDESPVIALADFPRRERCKLAIEAGAATVLGKPWLNADLLDTLERLIRREGRVSSSQLVKRAA
jgi:DNA-binding response OmpR family regulator